MWPFTKKKNRMPNVIADSLAQRIIRDRNAREEWRSNLQTLFHANHNDIIIIRGCDIECVWIDTANTPRWVTMPDGQIKPNPQCVEKHMMCTRSGQVFELSVSSWLKCRFEDASYGVNSSF